MKERATYNVFHSPQKFRGILDVLLKAISETATVDRHNDRQVGPNHGERKYRHARTKGTDLRERTAEGHGTVAEAVLAHPASDAETGGFREPLGPSPQGAASWGYRRGFFPFRRRCWSKIRRGNPCET